MKSFFTMTLLLVTGVASAQTDRVRVGKDGEDSLLHAVLARYGGSIPYNSIMKMDTTGISQYGGRIYDPHIARYMRVEAINTVNNPYKFVREQPSGKKRTYKAMPKQ